MGGSAAHKRAISEAHSKYGALARAQVAQELPDATPRTRRAVVQRRLADYAHLERFPDAPLVQKEPMPFTKLSAGASSARARVKDLRSALEKAAAGDGGVASPGDCTAVLSEILSQSEIEKLVEMVPLGNTDRTWANVGKNIAQQLLQDPCAFNNAQQGGEPRRYPTVAHCLPWCRKGGASVPRTDRLIDKQTDRRTDRQTDRHTVR